MKKIVSLSLAAVVVIGIVCVIAIVLGQRRVEEPVNMEPQASQMKAICELAVMECYYHNVAKYFEKDATRGILGIGKKDKHFWVEYSGVVKLGVDVSLVNIEVIDTQITITLPEAKVLGCKIESSSLSEDSFIVDKKSADIEGADEIAAFDEAQSKLEENAANDKTLLANAQQRAQNLLEEYITNIGNAVGKQYSIKWSYVDANGNPLGTVANDTATSTEIEEPAI